jgi:hypothetical protein
MSKTIKQLSVVASIASITLLGASAVVMFSACGGGTSPTNPTPTSGSLTVFVGYGAVTNPPRFCDGISLSVAVVNSQGVLVNTLNVSGSGGISSTTAPACQAAATLASLNPGAYTVRWGNATCPVTVTAGQGSTAYIRTEFGGTCTRW